MSGSDIRDVMDQGKISIIGVSTFILPTEEIFK